MMQDTGTDARPAALHDTQVWQVRGFASYLRYSESPSTKRNEPSVQYAMRGAWCGQGETSAALHETCVNSVIQRDKSRWPKNHVPGEKKWSLKFVNQGLKLRRGSDLSGISPRVSHTLKVDPHDIVKKYKDGPSAETRKI